MRLSLLVAVAEGGVIGRDGGLPWRLPADLRRFKSLTMGHHLLMGRRTWASIGRALPGRTTVVISRGRPALPEGVLRVGSLAEAVAVARASGDDEPFVVGGGEIYRLALPIADRVYLTRVHARVAGDVTFPELAEGAWREVHREQRPADADNPYLLTFLIYDRRGTSTSRDEAATEIVTGSGAAQGSPSS